MQITQLDMFYFSESLHSVGFVLSQIIPAIVIWLPEYPLL